MSAFFPEYPAYVWCFWLQKIPLQSIFKHSHTNKERISAQGGRGFGRSYFHSPPRPPPLLQYLTLLFFSFLSIREKRCEKKGVLVYFISSPLPLFPLPTSGTFLINFPQTDKDLGWRGKTQNFCERGVGGGGRERLWEEMIDLYSRAG